MMHHCSRWILALVLVVVISFNRVDAQVPEPQGVVPLPVYDFGKIAAGASAETTYSLLNKGSAPLEIQKIVASCGCTVASADKKLLQPGESAIVSAKYDSKGFFGKQVKNIRVYTNDPYVNSFLLTMRGEVERDFALEPGQFFFGNLLKGATPSLKVELKSNKPGIIFSEVATRSDAITVTSSDEVKNNLAVKVLQVSIKPTAPEGIIRSIVSVRTTSASEPVVFIPLFAKIQKDLQATPSYISFDLLESPLAGPVSKTLDLKNVSGDSPKIVSIESDSPYVTGSVKTLKSGKLFQIEVTLSPEATGIIRAQLTITSDRLDESSKSVTVPVYASIAKKGD